MSESTNSERIVVLGGGVSSEREVSLASSRAVYEELSKRVSCVWMDLQAEAIPEALDPGRDVIFPVLHGAFGEDGRLQALLEKAGFAYVGCDAAASARCMDKSMTKQLVAAAEVPVAAELRFKADAFPAWETVTEAVGSASVVLKPADQGSSVGLYFCTTADEWEALREKLAAGDWMVEPRLTGYDVTVGVLDGEPLGVIGIHPAEGAAYDYAHKYTAGATRYEVPANLPPALTDRLREAAGNAFAAVGARDFARVDFILADDQFTFLEINTIPGLTATSLLPKSASVCGLDFGELVESMLAPARERFQLRKTLSDG